MPMTGASDLLFVFLSGFVAVAASYISFTFTGRVTIAAHGHARRAWLVGATAILALGIWGTHFVDMPGFNLPLPRMYDVPGVLSSLLVALLASATALYVVNRSVMGRQAWLVSGLVIGLGIVTMDYIGMAAMRVQEIHTPQSGLEVLTIVIAIGASLVALWLALGPSRQTSSWHGGMQGRAIAMGVAVAGMNYAGMLAALLTAVALHPSKQCPGCSFRGPGSSGPGNRHGTYPEQRSANGIGGSPEGGASGPCHGARDVARSRKSSAC